VPSPFGGRRKVTELEGDAFPNRLLTHLSFPGLSSHQPPQQVSQGKPRGHTGARWRCSFARGRSITAASDYLPYSIAYVYFSYAVEDLPEESAGGDVPPKLAFSLRQ
jgi:hypothetical protein